MGIGWTECYEAYVRYQPNHPNCISSSTVWLWLHGRKRKQVVLLAMTGSEHSYRSLMCS
jgi:hypothetical protein